jgi:hypothetical protein
MHVLQIFHKTLDLPCDKTVMSHNQSYQESIALVSDHFDGTIDNITKILQLFLPISDDGRVAFAVDAA